jgi:hypothetical protein
MTRKFWVIGGEFDDAFARVIPGTERVRGPFAEEWRAQTEWRRLTFAQRTTATTRYTIAAEGPAA